MSDTPTPDEIRVWITRAKKGDKTATAALYEAFVDRIYRYIALRVNESDAEDLTAEVFLVMVKSLPKYRHGDTPFEAWLYQIASNRVNDFHRQNYRTPQIQLSDQYAHDAPTSEETMLAQEEMRAIQGAMGQLSEEQRLIIILRFVERLSHQAVATLLGKKMATVKSIQHRALQDLAKSLQTRKIRHYFRGGGGQDE